MRIEEINKWIDECGSLPEDLTQEEKEHLTKLGWREQQGWRSNEQKWYENNYLHGKMHGKQEDWWSNGQKWSEMHFLHGMNHGVFKEWDKDGNLLTGEEYLYGNRIK